MKKDINGDDISSALQIYFELERTMVQLIKEVSSLLCEVQMENRTHELKDRESILIDDWLAANPNSFYEKATKVLSLATELSDKITQ